MKRLFYLSTSAFSDNQVSILHHFKQQYSVTYGVIIPCRNSNYTATELETYALEAGIDLILFKLKYRFRDPRLFISYANLVRTVLSQKPDVIFFANFDQLYLNLLLLLLPKGKTIIALHDVENHSNISFDKLKSLGKNLLISRFERFMTYSESQAQILRKRIPGKQIYSIALPLIDFGPLPVVNKPAQRTLLFFGNILYYKGLDILLNALGQMQSLNDRFRLVIAGRCDDWKTVYQPLVEGIKNVNVHIRFIENDEIPQLFAETDYLVLPYRDTTQSGPLMVAYNYNIPVLCSLASGFDEFTDPTLTPPRFDINNLQSVITSLKNAVECSSEEYNTQKSRQALFVKKRFSAEELTRNYLRMFADVAHKKSKDAFSIQTAE